MEDTCKDFKNWEDEMFWTHFQSIHFSQFLHADDFLQRLEIPRKFAKNIKKKLPEIVTLKGPSGVIWDVGLTEDGDALFFDGGWKTFAEDHSLVENDILIFKYNGVSNFDVLMFDGKSLCEKPSCYFVRKCMDVESDCGHQSERKASENPDDFMHDSSQCGLESSPEKSIYNEIGARPSTKPINFAASNTKKKIRDSDYGTPSVSAKRSLESKELNFPGKVKVKRLKTEYDRTTRDGDDFGSWHAMGKMVATETEKMNAFLKAREALTDDGFLVVMQPSHVLRKFYMSVPITWIAKHLANENANVILRMNKRTWKIRFLYHKGRDRGGLSGGWRNFVKDNNLVADDVCVFEPANIGMKPIILDVKIFHIPQPAVPPNHDLPPDVVEID